MELTFVLGCGKGKEERRRDEDEVKKLLIGLFRVLLLLLHYAKCPHLISLWAGETSCQGSTTRRQSSSERRATVGQEGLQVAREQALSRAINPFDLKP